MDHLVHKATLVQSGMLGSVVHKDQVVQMGNLEPQDWLELREISEMLDRKDRQVIQVNKERLGKQVFKVPQDPPEILGHQDHPVQMVI